MRPKPIVRRLVSCLPLLAFAGATLHPSEAEASGYLTARFGADQGAPETPNGYAIYFNPAALGGTTGTTITGDLSLAVRQVHYKRTGAALSPQAGDRDQQLADQTYINANTGDANLLNVVALPFAGVHTDFGTKNFHAGYAVYIPFGGSGSWDRNSSSSPRGIPGAPGSTDGVNRWANISGELLAIYNTFAFAYMFGDSGFSIGASISPVIHHIATTTARNTDDSDEITAPNGSLKEGRDYLDATGFNLQATGGVYWQTMHNRLRLGLAYLSQPGFGQTRMKGNLDAHVSGNNDIDQKIDFLQTYPDIIRLGGAFKPSEKSEVRLDGEFVRWSVFKRQCIVDPGKNCDVNADGSAAAGHATDIVLNVPRNWDNAVGLRSGGSYRVSDVVELGGSFAISTSAVPKSMIDAATIDSFALFFNAGARFFVSQHLAFAANYTHIYYLPVNTMGTSQYDNFAKPSQSPSADGKYTSQIGLFNLNAAYTF